MPFQTNCRIHPTEFMKSKLNSPTIASIAVCTFLFFPCSIAAADRSFGGVWELNLSKSKVTGEAFTYEKRGDRIHFDSHGYTYDFDLSGKEFPEPDGHTVTARQIDPQTWEITHRLQGKTNFVRRMVVNGDTLTSTVTKAKVDGFEAKSKTRVSGGPGLFGKWKSTEITSPLSKTLQIITGPGNSVTMGFPEMKWLCHAKFDGKDHPVTIDDAPSKTTVAF